MQFAIRRAELHLVVKKFGLVCAWLPRASRHTARGRLPGGGVPDVRVVLHLVLHLEGGLGQVLGEPRGDLVAPHLELHLLARSCIILPTNTLLSDLSLRCVPLLEQLLQGVVSLGGSFFWRQL